MHLSTRIAVACWAAVAVIACAKKEEPAADTATAAATPAPPPAPAPFSMADAAGKWQMKSTPTSGTDTSTTTYVLTATADTTGWTITFPSGLKVPMKVTTAGDSLVYTTGTFASQRRKGVKVSTNGVMRLQDGKLVGTTTAHYTGTKVGADSVLVLRSEGTKAP